ncbi:MAG: zf-TFIIB domain-containing protein [Xanthomonadales bacterium]|nr:zf-TFIIB domain-containing protein [Xanthomonadales bacterium]
MQCPKCSGSMELVSYDKIEVDWCTDCGGLWFQPEELRALRDDIWMADYIIDSGEKSAGKKANTQRDYRCPDCNDKMLKESDQEQSHIIYESCPNGHGIYLDAGEFTDIVHKTFWDKFKRAPK